MGLSRRQDRDGFPRTSCVTVTVAGLGAGPGRVPFGRAVLTQAGFGWWCRPTFPGRAAPPAPAVTEPRAAASAAWTPSRSLGHVMLNVDGELAAALEELERKKKEVRDLEDKIEQLRSRSTQPLPDQEQQTPAEQQTPESGRRKKKPGVAFRKGRQEKGGTIGAGCYEENAWDPKIIMPALGTRPIGHIRTCFPRKNGDTTDHLWAAATRRH
jgi:hypothetical protein